MDEDRPSGKSVDEDKPSDNSVNKETLGNKSAMDKERLNGKSTDEDGTSSKSANSIPLDEGAGGGGGYGKSLGKDWLKWIRTGQFINGQTEAQC